MLQFAAVILHVDTPHFYDEHVRGHAATYQEFKSLMRNRFNNREMQYRIKTYLQGLMFNKFTRNDGSPNDALIKLVTFYQAVLREGTSLVAMRG